MHQTAAGFENCREFHGKERTRLLDAKLQPELQMSCNVSRRLRREGLVNSAVKTDNFSLKTVELSWLEHRENVTPATRASSIARSRDFWVMTSQETKNCRK